jgi:hypothetical protein
MFPQIAQIFAESASTSLIYSKKVEQIPQEKMPGGIQSRYLTPWILFSYRFPAFSNFLMSK